MTVEEAKKLASSKEYKKRGTRKVSSRGLNQTEEVVFEYLSDQLQDGDRLIPNRIIRGLRYDIVAYLKRNKVNSRRRVLIDINGSYFHGAYQNKTKFNKTQREHIKEDLWRSVAAMMNDDILLFLWEHEIKDDDLNKLDFLIKMVREDKLKRMVIY